MIRFVDDLGDDARLSVVSVAELVFAAERLPAGQRSDRLRLAIEALIEEFVGGGRCLAIDAVAAAEAARFRARRESAGRPVTPFDSLIAGTCRAAEARLATRNVRDFADAGLTVVDPWAP